MNRLTVLLCFVVLSAASCGGGEGEDPVPTIAGSYNLVAQQRDSDCAPETASADAIFGFMDATANGVPVMTAEIAQVEDSLSVELGPSGCIWTGLVDSQGALTLSGPCDEAALNRTGHLGAIASEFGDGWSIEGTLRLEIDAVDGGGSPGPDGLPDCEVELDVTGTGY